MGEALVQHEEQIHQSATAGVPRAEARRLEGSWAPVWLGIAWAWAGAIGCASPDSLLELPIRGATAAQEAALRAELAAFEAATGAGRTRVRSVTVADLGGRRGLWRPIPRRIELSEGEATGDMVRILRHELCHALDFAEGPLHLEHDATYTRMAAHLHRTEGDVLGGGDDPERRRKREVFALSCEEGPWMAHAHVQPCPDDDPDLSTIARHLAEVVWTRSGGLERAALGPTVRLAPDHEGGAPESFTARGMGQEPIVFAGYGFDDGAMGRGAIDVDTGAHLGSGFDEAGELWAPLLEPPDHLEIPIPSGARASSVVGWGAGPVVAALEHELSLGPQMGPRWAASDGGAWALIGEGCPDPSSEPFAAGGRVFAVELSDTAFTWRPVVF